MIFRSFANASLLFLLAVASAFAQFKDADPEGVKMGQDKVQKWQAGISITASGGACKNITGYAPIPIEWPEQQVSIVKEDVSPGVKIGYENREGSAKVMTIRIPQLAAGQEVKAVVTLEIRRNAILPPDKTDNFVLPNVKKLPVDVRRYLAPSPLIESTDPKIKKLSKEIGADEEKAWEKVEAYYDWVREHVKYQPGAIKGALAGLKDGFGDCEELTSLFIALCRAAEIPARTVWVQGHCYPEFYLDDENGTGHWFPCQIAGSREFGGIVETRPILQKGDNFKPHPGQRKHQRYLAEFLTGTPVGNADKPTIRSVRALLP
ncbi:MAG: transglutaminase family protein [Pirellulales bacterium]|nr:transglutaminase family protein [Pirellulales bacterium]